jgi:hypothetical protein
LLASTATTLVVVVSSRKGLLIDGATPTLVRSMVARGVAAAAVIVVSIPVALVAPNLASLVWLLLAVAPRVAERRQSGRPT